MMLIHMINYISKSRCFETGSVFINKNSRLNFELCHKIRGLCPVLSFEVCSQIKGLLSLLERWGINVPTLCQHSPLVEVIHYLKHTQIMGTLGGNYSIFKGYSHYEYPLLNPFLDKLAPTKKPTQGGA